MINELKVFLPAHITGFFEIITNDENIVLNDNLLLLTEYELEQYLNNYNKEQN